MKSSDLIGGAFAGMTAPFGVHPSDRQRAYRYLGAALQEGLAWQDADAQIRAYLTAQGCTAEFITKELNRARDMLEPWLG